MSYVSEEHRRHTNALPAVKDYKGFKLGYFRYGENAGGAVLVGAWKQPWDGRWREGCVRHANVTHVIRHLTKLIDTLLIIRAMERTLGHKINIETVPMTLAIKYEINTLRAVEHAEAQEANSKITWSWTVTPPPL